MEVLVLAAGKGTRLRSRYPKVLHEILGRPILDYVLEALAELGIRRPKIVVGSEARKVCSFIEKRSKDLGIRPEIVFQTRQKGTGHAVMMARRRFNGYRGDFLIWPGDMPALQSSTLKQFMRDHQASNAEASVLSSLRVDPTSYGRILRTGGRFYAIREEVDATEIERRNQEVNTGVYLFKADRLFDALRQIKPNNKKKEYYLTDAIEVLAKQNRVIESFPLASSEEGQGINSREDLATVIRIMNRREIRYHQTRGVTFVAPDQTFVARGVKIGRDTVIYPWSYIESGVKIGQSCRIGPFAKIRKGSVIEDLAQIGSFVEVTRSRIGKKALAKHLAYIGDSVIGAGTNIGAGTITANFDGKKKNRTRIGKNVLVGCNTVFVAPVTVGDRARTGAGAVLKRNSHVKKGEVVVGVPAHPLHSKKKRG